MFVVEIHTLHTSSYLTRIFFATQKSPDSKPKVMCSSLTEEELSKICLFPEEMQEIRFHVQRGVESTMVSQMNAIISTSFPSPGTGRALVNEHKCGIYLLHQCKQVKTAAATSADDDDHSSIVEEKESMMLLSASINDGNRLRGLLRVNPWDGLHTKNCYKLECSEFHVQLSVIPPPTEHGKRHNEDVIQVGVMVFKAHADNETDYETGRKIVNELEVLCS